MKIGTKSVLYGGHQFLIHPWFVAWAWWKLFGFPLDPRLWAAFFVHDIGYIGKPNMDGAEGETHVELGANIMHILFDCGINTTISITRYDVNGGFHCRYFNPYVRQTQKRWRDFTMYHSRFYAKKHGTQPSRLCIADKLAITLTPRWLYLPLARATGEIHEYMKCSAQKEGEGPAKYAAMKLRTDNQKQWHGDMCDYLRRWVDAHMDGSIDNWTPETKQAVTDSGVWK